MFTQVQFIGSLPPKAAAVMNVMQAMLAQARA
jgi:hypothetical protein